MVAETSKHWNWSGVFTQQINKACTQFRLRIEDEANAGFGKVLSDLLAETDKEVKELLAQKKLKIEAAMRTLQNNEMSRPVSLKIRGVPKDDAKLPLGDSREVPVETLYSNFLSNA